MIINLHQKPNSAVDTDFPYQPLPYINMYQYPPIKPINSMEALPSAEKLALDQPMPWEKEFTIFVSVPYCRVRCFSCPYFKEFLPTRVDPHAFLNDYLDCLEIQIGQYAATTRFSTAQCRAVYLGGGTASLLFPDQVARLIAALRRAFRMPEDTEITLEGNPREFTHEYLQRARESGVNRVSLGYQSQQDAILKGALNSPHDGNASSSAAKAALAQGFHTVNLDMLYRIPGQTFADWQYDVRAVLELAPESVTIFPYVVHSGSNSERLIQKGRLQQQVDMNTAHEWRLWAKTQFEKHGYIEQRKSGFVKPGHEQKYGELSYVKGCEMIGLGAGAYGWLHRYQIKAPNNANRFKKQIRNGIFPAVGELSIKATDRHLMERYIIFHFSASVLNRVDFKSRFGNDPLAVFPQIFSKLERHNLVTVDAQEIRLTALGKKWRNNVRYEFFADQFK